MRTNLYVNIVEALKNIMHSKLRSGLALLGILIGTASVVAMVSGGEMATKYAIQQFAGLGVNLLSVSLDTYDYKGPELTLAKALDTKNISPSIREVDPYLDTYTNVSFNGMEIDGGIIGTMENILPIMKLSVMQGRFVSHLDRYSSYCVIGNDVYQKIKRFDPNPIGKQLRLGTSYFTIVGITGEWAPSTFISEDLNRTIFIPVQAAKLIDKNAAIRNIIFWLKPKTNIDLLEQNITGYFAKVQPGARLNFMNAKEFIKRMEKQRDILTMFLGLVASISLLVGGIGVMNIMLASVTERRQEIGIRRAVGAKRRDIQLLFLIEAVMLAVTGGVIGVILGEVVSFIVARIEHWQFTLFFDPAIVGFCVSVFIGIFFGFYPARKASKLDPIETIRL